MVSKRYSVEEKQATLARVAAGESVKSVSVTTGTPGRTIRKWMAAVEAGKTLQLLRPGPKPRLPPDAERHIYDWVVGRQIVGHPVDRAAILRKAQEVSTLVCEEVVGEGWYRRFVERFPDLTGRVAQSLSLKRNCVAIEDMNTLFFTLAKIVIELRIDCSRVFNMDETAFQTQTKSKRVVAVRGSTNIWTTDPTANFHLCIVACVSAGGFVVPPVFVLPGKTVQPDLLDVCISNGAAVTTSESGFINTSLFQQWLYFLAQAVPMEVNRPLLLILDGCASHYSADVLSTATELDILLVFLPPNATHLLQPLDVAAFATLKTKLRNLIGELVVEGDDGSYSISKPQAIKLASMAWEGSNISRNVSEGFRACGLYPLNLVKMQRRLRTYETNGVPRHIHLASCLRVKSIVEEGVLTLPAPATKKGTRRKRVAVGGRVLTKELLQQLSSNNKRRSPKKPRRAPTQTTSMPDQPTTEDELKFLLAL